MRRSWNLAALAAGGLLAAGATAPAAVAADDCPNAKVRAQQGVQHLPNCLAYEKITPNNKNGAKVAAEFLFSDDGTETWVNSNAPITAGVVSGNVQTLLASRGTDGWNLEPLTNTPQYSSLRTTGPSDDLRPNGVQGMRRILFESIVPYDAGDVAGGTAMATNDLYMREPDGSVRWLTKPRGFAYTTHQSVNAQLVYVAGTPDLSTALLGANRVFDPAVDATERQHLWIWRDGKPYELVDYMPDGSPSTTTRKNPAGIAGGGGAYLSSAAMVTPDLSTVVWETHQRVSRTDYTQLYVRVGIGTPQARTLMVSASEGGTPCVNGAAGNPSFQGLTLDGRYVRFTCSSKLTDDAPTTGGPYVKDTQTGAVIYEPTPVDRGPTTFDPDRRSTDIKWTRPDGSFSVEKRAGEFWSVDLRTGDETCATCSAAFGGFPTGASFMGGLAWASNGLGYTGSAGGPGASSANNITPDGDVFFQSSRQLVPEDTNAFEDLYLSVKGKVYLLSGGQAPQNIQMGGISLDGSTASFATQSSLLAEDRDGGVLDVYVLRRNGGFFRESAPAECSAGCQGPASQAPPVAVPLSVSFAGVGDLSAKDDDGAPIAVSGSRSVRGTSLEVKVRVPGAGHVSVSGSGVNAAVRSLRKASSTTLRVRLSARSQRLLRRKGVVRVTASVRFVPSSGEAQTKRVKLTFRKQATSKKRGSSRGVAAASNGKAAR